MTGTLDGARKRLEKETSEDRHLRMSELGKISAIKRQSKPEAFKKRMGKIGKISGKGGFASEKIGEDGLTGPQRAKSAQLKAVQVRAENMNHKGVSDENSEVST